MTATITPAKTFLTPSDTLLMLLDAMPFALSWAQTSEVYCVGDPVRDTCTEWSCEVGEKGPGGGMPVTVNHETWLATMHTIVARRDEIDLHDSYIDQIAAVLDAASRDDATDETCQLDVTGFDAILQIAVLGQLVYG